MAIKKLIHLDAWPWLGLIGRTNGTQRFLNCGKAKIEFYKKNISDKIDFVLHHDCVQNRWNSNHI